MTKHMFFLLLALAGTALLGAPAAEGQNWRTISSARQVSQEKELNVELVYAAGRLELAPAEDALLYRMEVRYDEDQFAPVADYQREQGVLRLGVRSRDQKNLRIDGTDEARASVALSPHVPITLELAFGAGEAELDLGGLALRAAEISTGASETRISFGQPNRIRAERVEIKAGAAELHVDHLGNARAERIEFAGGIGETVLDFGGEWTRSASVAVKMGIGEVTLRIPRELGVKLTRNSLLTSFDANGLVKRGRAYYSRNWDSAPHHLTFTVDAALGEINVEWID